MKELALPRSEGRADLILFEEAKKASVAGAEGARGRLGTARALWTIVRIAVKPSYHGNQSKFLFQVS